MTSYRRLLASPGVPSLAAVALITRLGTPMLSLAMVLAVVEVRGSYATAGVALAAHALTVALAAPVGGRLADRYGPRRVIATCLAVHVPSYALVVAVVDAAAPPAVVGAAALLGLSTPPSAAVVRALWPGLAPPELLPAAYAVDSVTNEIAFVLGPVLVALLMLAMSAHTVVVVTGAGVLAGLALLIYGPLRHIRPRAARPPSGRLAGRLGGPLRHRPTLVLLVVAATGTFGFGCLRIATVAAANGFGSPASAGMLMSLLSAGTFVGAVAFGGAGRPVSHRALLVSLCLADAVTLAANAAAPSLALLAALVAVTGLLAGPRDTIQALLLAGHAPERRRTEVFGWHNTFMWAGYGLGTAVAGGLTGPGDPATAAFLVGAAAAVAGALVMLAGYPARRIPSDAGLPNEV